VVCLLPPSASGGVQLEWPQEVGCILERFTNGKYFMYQIFHTDDVSAAQSFFNDGVGSQWNSSVVNLGKSTFVNQFTDCFQIRISPGNVGFANSEHVNGSLIQLNENSVVDLTKSEKLQSLSYLGMNLVDTPNPDNKSQFGFSWNVIISLITCLSGQTDFIALLSAVLLHVLFRSLEDLDAVVALQSPFLNRLLDLEGNGCLAILPALKDGFWDRREFLAGDFFHLSPQPPVSSCQPF